MMCLLVLWLLVTGCAIPSGVHALCPIRCTCDETKLSVDCKEASLDVVPITLNPAIAELFLNANHIKSISLSFSFYRKLRLLDLSGNALTLIGSGNFAFQRQLKVLFMNKNKISDLEKNTFSGLESLRVLSLSENHLKEIRDDAVFHPLQNLEQLDLSGNELTTLSPAALSGLLNLRSLHLQRNRFQVVPSQALSGLTALLQLDLSGNDLQGSLAEGSLALPSLHDLNLHSNAIESLSPRSVSGTLRSLDLSSNRLSAIPALDLPDLEQLTIGRNRIAAIGENAFSGLKNLKSLILRNDDSLNLIHMNAFSHNPLLERISIDFCPNLHTIEPETFIYAKENLRRVSLRANGIRHLPEHLFDWQELQWLDVRGNPFECSCPIYWFWDLIRDRMSRNATDSLLQEDHMREIICQEPPGLRGHELASISLKEMNCHQEKRADAASAASEESVGREMSAAVLIPVTIVAAILAAATTGLMAFLLARHRRRKLSEVRLKEYFSDSINNPNSAVNMSEEENMMQSKKEPAPIPEYIYSSIGSSPFDSSAATRLYDTHYQELDPRPALISSLSASPASSFSHSIRKTSNGTSVKYQQRNPSVHMNFMQSPQPLPPPPPPAAASHNNRQLNPYSSSIVIQHPIKLDANLYRL